MGEITDALRRAKREQQPGDLTRSAPERPAAPATPPPQTAAAPRDEERVAITEEPGPGWPARAVLADHRGSVAENYRHLALRITRELAGRRARTLAVTSALREEGKTTTACNLALALASLSGGRPLALLDLDLRRPSVAESLGLRPAIGMEEVLAGRSPLAEVRVPVSVGALDVYPVRRPTRHAHELLAGAALPAVLQELGRSYDTIVIDTPPVLLVPDVPLAAEHVDAVLAVARAGVTRKRAFEEMLDHVNREKLLGVFLNEARTPQHRHQYGYYLDDDEEDEKPEDEAR